MAWCKKIKLSLPLSLSKLVVKPVGSHLLPWTVMATDYWDQIQGVLKRCVNTGSKFRNGPRPTLVSTLHIRQSAQAFRRTHCSSAANFCTPPSRIWFTWQIKRRYFAFSVKKHQNTAMGMYPKATQTSLNFQSIVDDALIRTWRLDCVLPSGPALKQRSECLIA